MRNVLLVSLLFVFGFTCFCFGGFNSTEDRSFSNSKNDTKLLKETYSEDDDGSLSGFNSIQPDPDEEDDDTITPNPTPDDETPTSIPTPDEEDDWAEDEDEE